MNFDNNKAIYEQIADRISDEIVMGKYHADDRIPSMREYASLLQVNTNTVVKAYDLLTQQGIIYNKRGLGYFASTDGAYRIKQQRSEVFMNNVLPEMFRQMRLLGIGIDEIIKKWDEMSQTPSQNV